jgi:predicted nucleotidyltransferase
MEQRILETVNKKLREIENTHNIKILYAVESGSRAWGFESADSDYDVRFIYVHHKNWYLNILPKRDVIEYPIIDEYDYSGWDLRKALFLVNKSNPVFFEWLKSPIVYYKDKFFYSIAEELSKEYFSPLSSVYHYLHMANGNYRQFLQSDEVKIKKYFYVLRPIMACMWIEKYKESPPMEFEKLLTQIGEKELLDNINELLRKKKSGVELGLEPKITIINDFIEKTLKHFEDAVNTFDPKKKPGQKLLEERFIKILDRFGKAQPSNKVILVAGCVAAGKTTFALKLSKELNIPCFNKDLIKIELGKEIPVKTREESLMLSRATFNIMIYILENFMMTGKPLILESNFGHNNGEIIRQLLKK